MGQNQKPELNLNNNNSVSTESHTGDQIMVGISTLSWRRVVLVSAAIGTAMFFAPGAQPTAQAQQVSGALVEEITVTVRRREETVKDVPATVYVFTAADIERSNITRASDIVRLTPGVTLVDAAEVADTQVNIRGMNGARDAEVSYALIIDGIQMTNPAALNREYANLQQIEVLKGPQGALYGRNAASGAFIITTNKPGNETSGRITASAGEDASYYVAANVGGAISADKVFYSLNAEYRETDGFYKNVFLNRDDVVDNFENWAIGGRLIFEISDKASLDTKIRYGEVETSSIAFNSSFQIPFLGLPPPDGIAINPAFFEDVNEHPFQFNSNMLHPNDQESLEISAKFDYEMNWGTLTAWGLYSDIDNGFGADGTSGAFGFFHRDQPCVDTTNALGVAGANFQLTQPQFLSADIVPGDNTAPYNFSTYGAYTPTTCDGTQWQERNQEDYSFEFRLSSPSDQRFRWMAGVYYLNIEREVGVNLGIDNLAPGQGIIQQLFTTDPANPTEQLAHDRFDTDVTSVFGEVAWDITDALEAAFALRYDKEDRDVTNLVPNTALTAFVLTCTPPPPPPPGPPPPAPPAYTGGEVINAGLCVTPTNPTGTNPDKNAEFEEWQPKLSLTWDATDNWTFFGSLGVGFKAGGFNNQGSEATVDLSINGPLGLCDPAVAGCVASGLSRVGLEDQYREETSTSGEIGVKSTMLDNRIRFEAAIYRTEVDDLQFFEFFTGPFGLLRVVENIDEVELQGVEAAFTWNAAAWLDLFVGGAWIDSEIKKNAVRPDTVGNESPYTPEYTFNLGAYLNFPVTGQMNFFTNLDFSGVGDTWFHAVQNQTRPTQFLLPGDYSITQRKSYELLNVRLGLETERWTLALWGTNATDEEYLEEVIPAPEFGGSFIHVGTQSRWGVDATWRFGS